MQRLLVHFALIVLLVITTILEPVFASFTFVSSSSSSSWHHHHDDHSRPATPPPQPTWRYKLLKYQQTSLQLRDQAKATAVEPAQEEISLIYKDDKDDNNDVATLRSVTFHNLPKNIDNENNENNEKEEVGPDLLADFLMEIGACSVSLTDSDAGTELESPVFHEPSSLSNDNNMAAWYDSLHWAAPIWNRCNVTAHFPASINIPHVIQLVQETFPQYQLSIPTTLIETIPNRDWVVYVQSSWKPILVPSSGGVFGFGSSSTSSSRNFNNNQDDNEPTTRDNDNKDEIIRRPLYSSRADGRSSSTLFVLQFPWHSNEDVLNAIQEQQQQQQSTAVADISTTLQQQQQQQQGQKEEETNKNIITIQLQGGIAFGTGEHATTQLCLQWLDRVIPRLVVAGQQGSDSSASSEQHDNKVLRILDYGAGSGILGIAALKLAAAAAKTAAAASQQQQSSPTTMTTTTTTTTTRTAHAVGIDIDMDACRIANANAIINNVAQFKTYLPPLAKTMDAESKSLLLKARAYAAAQQQQQVYNDNSDTNDDNDNNDCLTMTLPIQQQEQLYDVCVANILAAPLIALAPEIVAMLKPTNGWLGMSGILPQQGPAVIDAYTAAGLQDVTIEQEMGGWILVTGCRRAGEKKRQ